MNSSMAARFFLLNTSSKKRRIRALLSSVDIVETPFVYRAFHGGWLLPLLGILFLPITTLAYVLVYYISGDVTGWGWLWVVLAFILDLGAHSAPARQAVQARSRSA